ncbi:N-acetyltransferase [Kineococcus sp. NUM-3379]
MRVRPEVPADAGAVAAVHTAAFAPPGARPGVAADVPEARLVAQLRRDGDTLPALCLVAEHGGSVVGSVVCSRASLGGRPCVALGPLGVLPAHQGRGVGSALVRAALAAADDLGEPAVVLLGHTTYYPRFGFRPAAGLGVVPPVPEWAPHFQVCPLTAWHPGAGGLFRYAPAFGRL